MEPPWAEQAVAASSLVLEVVEDETLGGYVVHRIDDPEMYEDT